jgi:putative ATP-dependent endonuclease of OLD family
VNYFFIKESEAAKRTSFLLIEEPESHVHAQRQLKLIQSLEHEAEKEHPNKLLSQHILHC